MNPRWAHRFWMQHIGNARERRVWVIGNQTIDRRLLDQVRRQNDCRRVGRRQLVDAFWVRQKCDAPWTGAGQSADVINGAIGITAEREPETDCQISERDHHRLAPVKNQRVAGFGAAAAPPRDCRLCSTPGVISSAGVA